MYTERSSKILGGTLVVKGTRIPVSTILYLLSRGKNIQDIAKVDYPYVSANKLKRVLEEIADRVN